MDNPMRLRDKMPGLDYRTRIRKRSTTPRMTLIMQFLALRMKQVDLGTVWHDI